MPTITRANSLSSYDADITPSPEVKRKETKKQTMKNDGRPPNGGRGQGRGRGRSASTPPGRKPKPSKSPHVTTKSPSPSTRSAKKLQASLNFSRKSPSSKKNKAEVTHQSPGQIHNKPPSKNEIIDPPPLDNPTQKLSIENATSISSTSIPSKLAPSSSTGGQSSEESSTESKKEMAECQRVLHERRQQEKLSAQNHQLFTLENQSNSHSSPIYEDSTKQNSGENIHHKDPQQATKPPPKSQFVNLLDDEQSNQSYDSDAQEDDVNTVDSGTTTHGYTIEEANQIQAPKSTRYQLILTLESETKDAFNALINGKEKDQQDKPKGKQLQKFYRVRDILLDMYYLIKSKDKDAKIISWDDAKDFTVISDDVEEFPKTQAELRKYFDGFRGIDEGKLYLKFRLHASRVKEIKLAQMVKNWAEESNYAFTKSFIQAVNISHIGWLVYSSAVTNTEYLSTFMNKATNGKIEWGFRLTGITRSDEDKGWVKRNKALGVYVSAQHIDQATATMTRTFSNTISTQSSHFSEFTKRYIFVQSEQELLAIPDDNTMRWYKGYLERQETHTSALLGKYANGIHAHLDALINTKQGDYLSLREMILKIKSQNVNPKLFDANLFHGVDFCADTSKVYINGIRGPGGPAHIFSFYSALAPEALAMVKGLGIYLATKYGTRQIRPCFTSGHWETNKGWTWNDSLEEFNSPEAKNLKNTFESDPNAGMMAFLANEISAKDQQKSDKEEEDEKLRQIEADVALLAEAVLRESNYDFINKVNDKDLDSLDGKGMNRPLVREVNVDDTSEVSSKITGITGELNNTKNNMITMTMQDMAQMANEGSSKEELADTLKRIHLQKIRNEEVLFQRQLKTFLDESADDLLQASANKSNQAEDNNNKRIKVTPERGLKKKGALPYTQKPQIRKSKETTSNSDTGRSS